MTSPATGLGAIPRVNVEIRGLSKAYGEAWEVQQVIADLDLDVSAGQLTVVIGPSGCGKSTLVNLIAGFEQPDSGTIKIDGVPAGGPGRDRMVVFQETALMPWLTVRQNVSFGPKLRGDMDRATLRAEADRLIEKVGLGEFKDKYPLQLSGGMQRRAELARAMMNQPKLMIMDEPFRGLDAMSRELMQEFFLKLFEENRRTNLFVTSEIDEAIFLADRLVVLSNRPATVRRVIPIELPRPRTYDMLGSAQAYEYKREALDILHQEAMKSFKKGGGQSDFLEAYAKRVQ
ncbi:MAG: ABC transporter ATP-binding protein [Alphaproteobacteria bacterium]|nr:ABC transporter ATP-binding protein [Alphaproteobacteria bacterium]